MSLITLDPEHEYEEVTYNLGGVFIDMMAGRYIINVLEPKQWSEDIEDSGEDDVPVAFKQSTVLAQHISFLKDFFKTYKAFTEEQIDTLEIMLVKVYQRFTINEKTDLSVLES